MSAFDESVKTPIATRASDLVGNTPLMDLTKIVPNCKGRLLGKLESQGPCNSVKDRLGKALIDDGEARGILVPGKSVIVEPTSGNTGIALAFIARERGYRCILTMPESMSVERRLMLLALGAEVVLTPKKEFVPGAIAKAKEIVESLNGDGVMLNQFENPANPKVHRETTGPEIWRDTDGNVDVYVSGVGTGGTLSGVAQYIKGSEEYGTTSKNPNLHVVAVEPKEQMLITAARGGDKIGPQGLHMITGIGSGIISKTLDISVIDEVVPIHSEEAMEMALRLWLELGLPVGVSSGASIAAAAQVMSREEMAGKTAVAIIPSFGERYFTHPMFNGIRERANALQKQPLPPPFENH